MVEGQRNYKSKIKKKIRKKCPSMASYFAPSLYPELLVYTQTYMFTMRTEEAILDKNS